MKFEYSNWQRRYTSVFRPCHSSAMVLTWCINKLFAEQIEVHGDLASELDEADRRCRRSSSVAVHHLRSTSSSAISPSRSAAAVDNLFSGRRPADRSIHMLSSSLTVDCRSDLPGTTGTCPPSLPPVDDSRLPAKYAAWQLHRLPPRFHWHIDLQ